MTHKSAAFLYTRNQILFWLLVLAAFLCFIWLFSAILLPFVLGAVIAYLLDPAVRAMRRWNIPRRAAALLMLGSFGMFILLLIIFLVPLAGKELAQLASTMPGYIDAFNKLTQHYSQWLEQRFHTDGISNLQDALKNNIGTAVSAGGGLVMSLATGGKAVFDVLYILVLTPIIAFLMMNDWPRMKHWLDGMVPRRSHELATELWNEIDAKLAGFIRGQLLLSFFLGLYYSIALSVAGLNYGFLIGLMVGIGSLIPLVGSTSGLVTSLLIAWLETHQFSYVGIIAIIFFSGQFMEANFLTPRLLGHSVGLHPLWILFALMAGAALFGILGMLVAVPVAATTGVLIGHMIRTYKHSSLYDAAMGQP